MKKGPDGHHQVTSAPEWLHLWLHLMLVIDLFHWKKIASICGKELSKANSPLDLLIFVQAVSLSTNTVSKIFDLLHMWSYYRSLEKQFCVLQSHQRITFCHVTNRNCIAEYLWGRKELFVCFYLFIYLFFTETCTHPWKLI